MKYQVSRQGHALDPMEIDEIVTRVRAKELDLFDYIFDATKDDWVLLMEFPPLAAKLKSSKPPRPPKGEVSTATDPDEEVTVTAPAIEMSTTRTEITAAPPEAAATNTTNDSEWYVLKGENRFGPFSYLDVVRMLQQKAVFPFDMIWSASMENWKRLAEIPQFQAETIRSLFTKSGKKGDVFLARKHPRKPFKGGVVVHDNLTIWKGEGYEISKGGVGIQMSNSLVAPGQQVIVHFRQTDEMPAMNAVCEVVSKKFVNDNSPVQYGMRFLSLTQEVQDEFYKKVT
jgi:hypothetical protein